MSGLEGLCAEEQLAIVDIVSLLVPHYTSVDEKVRISGLVLEVLRKYELIESDLRADEDKGG